MCVDILYANNFTLVLGGYFPLVPDTLVAADSPEHGGQRKTLFTLQWGLEPKVALIHVHYYCGLFDTIYIYVNQVCLIVVRVIVGLQECDAFQVPLPSSAALC